MIPVLLDPLAIWLKTFKCNSYSIQYLNYATWVHVIPREASFPVGLVAACRWPIVTATVVILQN